LGGIVSLVNLLAAGTSFIRLTQLDTHNESNSLSVRATVGPDVMGFIPLLDDIYRVRSALRIEALSIW
jgi:hypothetical protein